jgi:formylglycine-generating enzyme required for sulfatase activity
MIDDAFLRQVAALQANLKMLESQQDALSDLADMKELRLYKSRLSDYIEAHARAGQLPRDPLVAIGQQLEALERFLQQVLSESRRLLDWRSDWLKCIPRVSLGELQQARTELAELELQMPGLQETLRRMLDPRDWGVTGNDPVIHPELRICAETVPNLNLPSNESCAELHGFSHGMGKFHYQLKKHYIGMGERIEELLQMHADHLSKVTEAEDHLNKENFRSAENSLKSIGKEKFMDIGYLGAEAKLEKQMALFGRFVELESIVEQGRISRKFRENREYLDTMRALIPNVEFELGRECQLAYTYAEMTLPVFLAEWSLGPIKRIICKFASIIFNSAREELKRQKNLEAMIELRAAKAKAVAERDAAEAQAIAEHEVVENLTQFSSEIKVKKVGSHATLRLASKVVMPFVFCPPGSFTMGSPSSEDGHFTAEKQVSVTLTKGFWMSKTEVMQAHWQAVMESNRSRFKGDKLPVEKVSWYDAQEFIQKINGSGVIPAGWQLALPTEAQWEYACRAGETGPYSGNALDEVAWYDGNSGGKTHPVGTKKPNAWGLHDMHGNVLEWCADWYDENKLPDGVDPTGPDSGFNRVYRGGCFRFSARRCRAADRHGVKPNSSHDFQGFRLALVASE